MRLLRLAVLVLMILVLVGCGGDDSSAESAAGAAEQSSSTPTAEPTATPEPGPSAEPSPTATPTPVPLAALTDVGSGPYAVGAATITITDEDRDRPLTVEVWFPLADGTTADPTRYTFVTGDYFESSRAIAASPADAADSGPFPLVVYSHGSGGLRYIHSDYTETIASHGYVVVAPDHTGNTSVERVLNTSDDTEIIALNRPLDVITVIDAMLDPADPETADFVGLADPDRVAVTGHSFGGFTTFAVASGYENPVGESPADARIGALIPLAPAVGDGGANTLLTSDQLAKIDQPTLIIVGTDDKTTPVDPNVETAWRESAASPHYRLELVAGEHQTFTDLCDYVDVLMSREDATPIVVDTIAAMAVEGCSPGDMPIERAQALTNTFAVTFLESVFRDGQMILPDTHEIPDDVLYAAAD